VGLGMIVGTGGRGSIIITWRGGAGLGGREAHPTGGRGDEGARHAREQQQRARDLPHPPVGSARTAHGRVSTCHTRRSGAVRAFPLTLMMVHINKLQKP
jgi:hypothetical protein